MFQITSNIGGLGDSMMKGNTSHRHSIIMNKCSLIEKEFYKNCPPEETIYRIREILHRVGIFITESSGYEGGFYHSHLSISNDNLQQFNLMTNGKGRSPEYALASAYSEMMERLQNGYKFYGEKFATKDFVASIGDESEFAKRMRDANAILEYVSYSDEKKYSLKEYLLSDDCIFDENQKYHILKHGDESLLNEFNLYCVPYYNIFDRTTKYMPADCFTSGSNGMCAGNTPAEALVQGMCELFERWALKMVMINEAVPPQIPLSYFEGTSIYNKIISLENTKVIILDCSFSKRLPVIGAIVINTHDNTFCLEMAGAPTATVALERCMTEHFQDSNPDACMVSLFQNIEMTKAEKYNQFYNQSKGFGKFDVKKILYSEPDYNFQGFHTVIGNSSEEELSYIVHEILNPLNLSCYIRDNSILGFPTYHIYIPVISDIYDIYDEEDLLLTFMSLSKQQNILNLKKQTKEELRHICKTSMASARFPRSSSIPLYANYLYNTYIRREKPDNDLFMATISLHIGDIDNTIVLLRKFVNKINASSDISAKQYYNCVLDLLELYKHYGSLDVPQGLARSIYGSNLVEEVVSDMSEEDKLQYYNLPTCFHCEMCPVKDDCHFVEAMTVVKKIQDNTLLESQDNLVFMMNQITGERRKSNKE